VESEAEVKVKAHDTGRLHGGAGTAAATAAKER
jgi:hypothetical protein